MEVSPSASFELLAGDARVQVLAEARQLPMAEFMQKLAEVKERTDDLSAARALGARPSELVPHWKVAPLGCPVCLQCSVDTVLPCGHGFCEACVRTWAEHDPKAWFSGSFSCPMCRRKTRTADVSFGEAPPHMECAWSCITSTLPTRTEAESLESLVNEWLH